MPRRVRSAPLETRSARLRLVVRRKPYFSPALVPGVRVGYRRNAGVGTWSVRVVSGHADWIKRLGLADDHEDADGETVLDYWQACEKARALARGAEGNGDRPATVAEALDRYEADLRARGGDLFNASRVRGHLTPTLASKPIAMLVARDLSAWRDGLVANGLTRSAADRNARAFKAALNFAAKEDSRITNGAAWRHGLQRLPDSEHARNAVLSDHTVREIVAAAQDAGDRDFALFVEIAAVAGARTSQILRLEVGDLIDDEAGPRLMMPSSKKGRRRRIERRPLPISPTVAAKLRLAAAGKSPDTPLLNVVRPGRTFARLVARLGLDKAITIYSLRHSNIVRMLLAGVPTRVVGAAHDTSVVMIERNYSRYIGDHTDSLLRGALLDVEPAPAAGNVVPLEELTVRGPPALSDEQWRRLLAAIASGISATADLDRARREIDDALHEFEQLNAFRWQQRNQADQGKRRRQHPDRVRVDPAEWRRLEQRLDEAASILRRISRQTPSDWPRQGFLALKPLRMRVHAEVTLRAVLAHAYEGRRDPVHDWLMGRLLDIWTDVLGGNLAVSTPSRGGPPTGPLVRFMCAIAELVLEAGRLSPYTVRTIVRARRKG